MQIKPLVLTGYALGLGIYCTTALPATNICYEPECGSGSGYLSKSALVSEKRAQHSSVAASTSKALGGENLQGTLAGSWDSVFGVVTFPYASQGLDLHLVALGLPATNLGDDEYSVSGWHREVFLLDTGDAVPRVLSAYLIDADFSPGAGNPLTESGQLWVSPNMLYREAEEIAADPDFYAGYPDGAAYADFSFVTDDSGAVLQVVADIHDVAGNYQYSVPPQPGDYFNPSFIAYDLAEPDVLYVAYYFEDPIAITQDINLSRGYFVPSAENDPELPEGFDAADLPMSLLLEGSRSENEEARFGYSPLKSLGYTWGEAKAQAGSGGSGGIGYFTVLLLMLLGMARKARAAQLD